MAVHEKAGDPRPATESANELVDRVSKISLLDTPLSCQKSLAKKVYGRLELAYAQAMLMLEVADDELLPIVDHFQKELEQSMQDVSRLI